jgi:hypothetical protein
VTDFTLDGSNLLVELAAGDDAVVFGVIADEDSFDARAAPRVTVAWRDVAEDETLAAIADREAGGVLLDRQPAALPAGAALRTFAIHKGPDGLPTASEQWRLLRGGRCWTVTALSALGDQPLWGPLLAAVATTFALP